MCHLVCEYFIVIEKSCKSIHHTWFATLYPLLVLQRKTEQFLQLQEAHFSVPESFVEQQQERIISNDLTIDTKL